MDIVNTVGFEGKGNLDSDVMTAFLNEEERADFEVNLRWVISQTTVCLLHLHLEDAYDLVESFLREWLNLIWTRILGNVLSSGTFLGFLKVQAAKKGYRFKGLRWLRIHCPGGAVIEVQSPYFIKADSKRKGSKKKSPHGQGSHLGLELLGFVKQVAPTIAMKAVAFSVVCPSFELASELLKRQGLSFDAKQLSRLSEHLSEKFFEKRVANTLREGETLAGKRVLITVDGGRSRQREKKRGRKPQGQKRRGYHTNWIEPKVLVILVLDGNGEVEREISPHVDGTIEIEDFTQLLEDYLQALHIEQAQEVFVCGDGAPWIWIRIPQLLLNLGVGMENLHEILDYTHAKQNLHELYEMLPSKAKSGVSLKQWKDWLFQGQIGKIGENILTAAKNLAKKAYKKFTSYFEKNQHRMRYETFKNFKFPCGSGVVESAIRRVINLRLKSCGSFWKKEKLVAMIYLRAQLLYGRWDCLMHNLLKTI